MKVNYQVKTWEAEFGKEYTDRNIYAPDKLDDIYVETFGVSRTEMNEEFFSGIENKDLKILEIGSNVCNQLRLLQKMGYENLYGIEPQKYAAQKSKELTHNINLINGTGEDIPFKDNYFDLVFTSGVLIHVSPENIDKVIKEIYRVTKKYIWGFEYFAENYEEINYRGNENLLWKANYSKMYQDRFIDLILLKEKKFKYLNSENTNSMFLLEKYQNK